MQHIQTHPHAGHEHARWTKGVLIAVVAALLLAFLQTGVSQLVAASLLIAVGAALSLLYADAAIVATLLYLIFLGDIRRLVSRNAGLVSQDMLLVVAPVVIGVLFLRLLFERKIRADTPLAKLVVALLCVMALEIVNPAQGGLTVGVAGALYYIVPLIWFWVGRSLPTEKIAGDLVRVFFPLLAALAAVLGLYQTFYGYLSFEAHWVRQQIAGGFAALIINGSVVRAFSFFTSPSEYSLFLGLGLVCCAAPLVVGRKRLVTLLIPLLVWALFLESVRAAVVLAAMAVLAMISLTGRNSEQMFTRAFLAVVLGGGIMYFGLHRLEGMDSTDTRMETLKEHTVDGLLNPGESSASGHLEIAVFGIKDGLKHPLGEGLGSTTMAATKMGSHGGAGYENDVANMFASLGVVGGLLYVVTILVALYTVFVIWRDRRSFVALATFGILVSQLGYWLQGGHYALVAICWFLIGSVDRAGVNALAAAVAQPVPVRSGRAHPAY